VQISVYLLSANNERDSDRQSVLRQYLTSFMSRCFNFVYAWYTCFKLKFNLDLHQFWLMPQGSHTLQFATSCYGTLFLAINQFYVCSVPDNIDKDADRCRHLGKSHSTTFDCTLHTAHCSSAQVLSHWNTSTACVKQHRPSIRGEKDKTNSKGTAGNCYLLTCKVHWHSLQTNSRNNNNPIYNNIK